jgi:stress-induced-phosphoprotein 1
MIDVLGALMGININTASDLDPGSSHSPPASPKPTTTPKPNIPTPAPPPPPAADVEMAEEDDEDAKAKKEAEALKKVGNEAYKKREFSEAVNQFEKAWEVWPKDITYLTNASGALILLEFFTLQMVMKHNFSAAYFEQGEYDKAIETCEKAVEEGRSVRPEMLSPRLFSEKKNLITSFALTTDSSPKRWDGSVHRTRRRVI